MKFRIGSFKNEKCEQDYRSTLLTPSMTLTIFCIGSNCLSKNEYLINMLPQNCEMKTSSIIDSSIRKKSGIKTLCGLE